MLTLRRPSTVLMALLLTAAATHAAPGVVVRPAQVEATSLHAAVGDTLRLEVAVDLGSLRAAGVALFLQLPAGLVPVEDTAPFRAAAFAGGVELANEVLPAAQTYGAPEGTALWSYAVVLGPGPDRFRSGATDVAAVDVVCTARVDGEIRLFRNPVHESMVVLDDGRAEVALRDGGGIRIVVGAAAARRTQGSWAILKAHALP